MMIDSVNSAQLLLFKTDDGFFIKHLAQLFLVIKQPL